MKKKLFMIFACLTFFVGAGYAQDVITKQNGEAIRAKILEVSVESVRYKKFELPDGPNYVLAASEVFMIKYENGSRDVFKKNPATGAITIEHIEAIKAQPSQPATTTQPTQPAAPAKPATTAPAKPAPTAPAKPATTAPETPAAKQVSLFPSGARIKQASNGTFTLLGFEGASLKFRAAVKTPIYMVSLVSGGQTVVAKSISNTKGNIVFDNGATAREGSSLLLSKTDMNLQQGTEAQCNFVDAPAGFKATTIVFLTTKNASPMTYNLAAGAWVTPQQTNAAAQSSSQNIAEDAPAQLQPTTADKTPDEFSGKRVKTIKFQGGTCVFDNVNLNPLFAPATMSREKEKSFTLALKYTLDAGADAKALSVLYNNGKFVAPNGESYKPGVALQKDDIYTLIVAVPKEVDVMTLKYAFDEQTLSLNKADNIIDKTSAELKVKKGKNETVHILSLGKIGHNDKGKTTVEIITSNNIISLLFDGEMFIPVYAKILADGKTVMCETISNASVGTYIYSFDTSAMPVQVTVYGNGDENSPPITFDVETKTIIE
jgi:hypothetical protein